MIVAIKRVCRTPQLDQTSAQGTIALGLRSSWREVSRKRGNLILIIVEEKEDESPAWRLRHWYKILRRKGPM